MKAFLDKIAIGWAVVAILFLGWKYYDYSGLDDYLEDSCKYKTYSQIRNVLKIENQNTERFCSCLGSRYQSNLGFIGSISIDQKTAGDDVLQAGYECRSAIQGN